MEKIELTAQEKVLIEILRNATPEDRTKIYNLICELAKKK